MKYVLCILATLGVLATFLQCSTGVPAEREISGRAGIQFIKIVTKDGKKMDWMVTPSETVEDLKFEIALGVGGITQVDLQTVGGEKMEDNRTLGSYGIHGGSQINAVLGE